MSSGWRRRGDWGDGLAAAFGVYGLLFLVWVAVGVGAEHTRQIVSDIAFLPVNLAAAGLAWRAAAKPALDPASGRAWRRLAGAFACMWVGDALWFGMEVLLGEPPFPSVADIAYLAFYPMLLWGLLSFPGVPRTRSERRKVWFDAATVTVAGLMVVWYLVVGPTLKTVDAGALATLLNVAYPVGDLLLLFGVTALLLRCAGRSHIGALRVLLAGVVCFVVADVAYAHLSLRDAYAGGDWPDAFWMAAQVLLVVSAQYQRRRSQETDRGAPLTVTRSRISRLPYLAIAVGYALLLGVGGAQGSIGLAGLIVGAGVLTAIVMARQVSVAGENARLLDELHRLATTDVLTGVRNRGAFLSVAEELFARGKSAGRGAGAALMIDVDHFKTINDTHGHAAGDAVLYAVAETCRAQLRNSDLLGRYGGDELVAFLPDASLDDALRVAERMTERIAGAPIVTNSGVANVTLSIGVADGVSAADLTELLALADRGLYRAKHDGRACVRPYLMAEPAL